MYCGKVVDARYIALSILTKTKQNLVLLSTRPAYAAINKGYIEVCMYNNPRQGHVGAKNVIVLGCIGIEKFIFGVAMAATDANATPNMNFFHLKSVL